MQNCLFVYYLLIIVLFSIQTTINLLLPNPAQPVQFFQKFKSSRCFILKTKNSVPKMPHFELTDNLWNGNFYLLVSISNNDQTPVNQLLLAPTIPTGIPNLGFIEEGNFIQCKQLNSDTTWWWKLLLWNSSIAPQCSCENSSTLEQLNWMQRSCPSKRLPKGPAALGPNPSSARQICSTQR